MRIKHFDHYEFLAELEFAIEEFSKDVEIINIKYQTIRVNGQDRFTAIATYNDKN